MSRTAATAPASRDGTVSSAGEPPRKRDRRDQGEVIPACGHESALETALGAQRRDLDAGILPAQRICESKCGFDVTGRAAAGEDDVHDQALLLRLDEAAGRRRHQRRGPERRAARAARAPGSFLASASRRPSASIVGSSADPPYDTSGSGTPVMGAGSRTAPRLTKA